MFHNSNMALLCSAMNSWLIEKENTQLDQVLSGILSKNSRTADIQRLGACTRTSTCTEIFLYGILNIFN